MKKYLLNAITFFLFLISFQMTAQDLQPGEDGLPSDTASLEDLMNVQLDESQIRKNMDNTKVVSASKSKENLASAPGLISVVTKDEIQAYGALTLVDVLNRVASIYVMGSFAFPQNLATIRGDLQTHTASHVLILIDGRPCRESFYSGLDLAIYNAFPMESIERIEIIRGPGSVLYGTNAYTGVINIITRREKKNTTQATVKGGSFGTGNASVYQSYNYKGLNLNLNGQYLYQDGWNFNANDQNDKNKTIQYGQKNVGIHMNANYKDFNFSGYFGDSNRDVFAPLRPIWDTTSTAKDYNTLKTYRAFADLGYKHKFSEKYNLSANATYNGFSQNSLTVYRPSHFESNDALMEVTNFISPLTNLNIVVGGLANYITGSGKGHDRDLNDENVFWVQPYDDLRWAAYTQIDYRPLNYLKLIIGGQVNKAPDIKANFVPRAGAILNFTEELGVKVLYGQAFKYAAQYERYVNIPFSRISGNTQLNPEIVSTLDAQLFVQKPNYQASAGYFYSKQNDVVILTTNRDPGALPRTQKFYNLGSLAFQGVEAEIKYLPIQQIIINGSFTYQENIDNEGTKNNTAISNIMAKGGISYKHTFFSIGLYNAYFSKPSDIFQQASTVNPAPKAFNLASLNATADINKIFKLKMKWNIQANIYINNLLDEKIYNPEFARKFINSIPATGGRAIYAGISLKL